MTLEAIKELKDLKAHLDEWNTWGQVRTYIEKRISYLEDTLPTPENMGGPAVHSLNQVDGPFVTENYYVAMGGENLTCIYLDPKGEGCTAPLNCACPWKCWIPKTSVHQLPHVQSNSSPEPAKTEEDKKKEE